MAFCERYGEALGMELGDRISRLLPHLIYRGRPREFESSAGQRYLQGPSGNDLVRMHRGRYVDAAFWASLGAEDRYLVRTLAVQSVAHESPVFSHMSAAVLHGLPIYEADLANVHVTTSTAGVGKPSQGVRRHRAKLTEDEICMVDGFRFTTIDRTIIDLCRDSTIETALVCADAHLRTKFRVRRLIDEDRLDTWRTQFEGQIQLRHGQRGTRTMRQVLALADARTDSVLETVSHLRLKQLGFEVNLQVPVPGPNGHPYNVDFEFVDMGLFGECDGRIKYTDAGLLRDESPAEVVYREKRRHDWICGREGKRLIRWGWADIQSTETLAARLRAFGVPVTAPPIRS